MLREIMIPAKQQITINIPKEYVHQTIEVLAFRLSENESSQSSKGIKDTLKLFSKFRGRYKGGFDREACYER